MAGKVLGVLALIVVAFSPLVGPGAWADEVDLHMTMTMAGVTAGSIKLSVDDQDDHTISRLSMKSQGFFRLLTGYKSKATAHSLNSKETAIPMPLLYDSTYETKSGERRIEIRYDDLTGDIGDLGYWKRGRPRKSKVPLAMRAGTVDPLTAMIRFRHWIRELRSDVGPQPIGNAEFMPKSQVLDVFDGRRRYRLSIALLDRLTVKATGDPVPAFRFKVDLEALAGFGKNDMLASWSSEDGQRWIEVIVTDEADPIPISMSTIGGSLRTAVDLQRVCREDDGCTKVRVRR